MLQTLKSVRVAATGITLAALVGLVGCANPQNGIQTATNDGAIIGGEEATGEEDFAKTIVLLYNVAEGGICTASILSKSILLTAAHCVEGNPKNMIVVFGTSVESATLEKRQVEAYKVSPVWPVRQTEDLNTGDIALVKFEGGLPEGYKSRKILADISKLSDGQTVMLAGYGNNDGAKGEGAGTLRYVETTIKQVAFSSSEILIEQSKGKGACHGDSGGPAYVEIDGKLVIVGVTSRGVNDPNNDCSVSAAYTSVAYYADWIARTAKELNKKKPAPQPTPAPAPVLARAQ